MEPSICRTVVIRPFGTGIIALDQAVENYRRIIPPAAIIPFIDGRTVTRSKPLLELASSCIFRSAVRARASTHGLNEIQGRKYWRTSSTSEVKIESGLSDNCDHNKVSGRIATDANDSTAISNGRKAANYIVNHVEPNKGSPLSEQASASVISSAQITPALPRSIRDISNGDHILGFGPTLSPEHPGFSDEEYKTRRAFISDLAKSHRIGEPIPRLHYLEEEVAVWGEVLYRLASLYPTHACSPFLQTFSKFDFRADEIPQLEDVSQVLKDSTGWQIRPVAGLLHPRDFLNGLAFKYFHSTQYVRHPSNPMYTPEPDICHELLGHVPLLAHPEFADVAQAIGKASLGASEKDLWHLTRLYWYTVEFGVVMERGEYMAFGAGLLSSFGELQHMRSKNVDFLPLDPFGKLPKMSYKDGFQKAYFVCSSFEELSSKLHEYALAKKTSPL